MRPRCFIAVVGTLLLLSAFGAQAASYIEGKWRHDDAEEAKFGGGTGPFDVQDTGNGDFVGKFNGLERADCTNGSSRDFSISGRIDGALTRAGSVPVIGTLTRCTNPDLVKKCKHDKTYRVPFQGTMSYQGPLKTLTMDITFKIERWKIPQCRRENPPRTVHVKFELALAKQTPQAQPAGGLRDCLQKKGINKFLTQDPTPLIDRCR